LTALLARIASTTSFSRPEDEIEEQAAEDPAFVDDPASVKPASGLPSTLRGGPDESIVSRATRRSIGYDLAVRPRRSAGLIRLGAQSLACRWG